MGEVMTALRTRYRVEGMDCASCAAKVDAALRRVPGVNDVGVSVPAGTVIVSHAGAVTSEHLVRQIASLGYQVTGQERATGQHSRPSADLQPPGEPDLLDHGHDGEHREVGAELHAGRHEHGASERPWWKTRRGLLTIACGFALAAAYVVGKLAPATERSAFLLAIAVGLVPVARRAVVAARLGTPFSIEMLMTIAAVGAVIIGATEEAATVVFLFLVGELLEGVAAGKARASIRHLTKLVPETALLERHGRTEQVPAAGLSVGTVIVIRPGDRIAADGVILSGESAIEEAPVTGESAPKRKGVDDPVFAGTINGDGTIRVRVTAAAQDNTIARVVRLVEEARESKAPTERFIDRFSRYYTPGVVAVGTLVAIIPPLLLGAPWLVWVYKGLAILLIGCPCALVISTPAAIAASLSAGARRGLLLKGGVVLEMLRNVTAVALDKTGTLTEGRPKVTDVVPLSHSVREVLSLAAALEAGSSHPLAKAILERAAQDGVQAALAAGSSAAGGKGVSGTINGASVFLGSLTAAREKTTLAPDQVERITAFNAVGKSVAILVVDRDVAGLIAMRDEPRPDAKTGLDALRRLGVTAVMLSGDNRLTADALAKGLEIEAHAELLPQDKQAIVRDMQARGEVVAKVGDGINDAPALAAADVGIAMGGGTDVALETADAAILHGRVSDIAELIALSKRTMANIHQNIAIALGLKTVFLVTTVLGLTGLWPAILADTGATVLVTMNALRLLRGAHTRGVAGR